MEKWRNGEMEKWRDVHMEPTCRNSKLIAILEEVLRKTDVDWEIVYLPTEDAHALKLNEELAFII